MLATINLYDTDRVKENDYQILTLNYNLTERQISDMFVTDWLELNPFDFICYDQIHSDYDYCKIFLDNELLYAGSILDANELQCKLKHYTRQDSKLGDTK